MFLSSTANAASKYNVNNSHEVSNSPSDGISSLAWFPLTQNNQTFLAGASWDKSVRVWDIRYDQLTSNVQSQPKAMFSHDAPVLSCVFSKQNALFSGGCDSVVKMHNLATNQSQNIGKHDAPVSALAFDDNKNICISASWDNTIRFWDCRQSNAAHTIQLGQKIYALDYKSPILIAAAADRNVYALSIDNLQATPLKFETQLKMQLRTIRLLHNTKGFAAASIEGRCGIVYIDESMKSNNFAFKCHRIEEKGINQKVSVYPVNSVDFHPILQTTLVTAGSDGTVIFWEISNKRRLKGFENVKTPINQCLFDSSGQLLAYSVSYDWHKGYAFSDPAKSPNKILIHPVKEDMIRDKNIKRRCRRSHIPTGPPFMFPMHIEFVFCPSFPMMRLKPVVNYFSDYCKHATNKKQFFSSLTAQLLPHASQKKRMNHQKCTSVKTHHTTSLDESKVSLHSTLFDSIVRDGWSGAQHVVVDHSSKRQRCLKTFGSYFNLAHQLELDRLKLFRGERLKTNHDIQQESHRIKKSLKSRFGWDGPKWKRYWERKRPPHYY